MTIILFIVDNSISMNQKTYSGCSLLDVAKKSVETFLKLRGRDFNQARTDRIMLMTFDEPPTHLKVGWRESLLVFQNELKNMQATAMSNGSQILSSAFELLNVHRLQTGIDTYGQGRNPFYVESCLVILITDGVIFSSQPELNITMNSRIPGLELTKEPYRWDHRLVSVVLRIPGVRVEDKPLPEELPRDQSVLEAFSSMTGGRSFMIDSVKYLDTVMAKIADGMQDGVMVRFEPLDAVAFGSASIAVNRMIYLPRNPQKTHFNGHWPLPEPFWPDLKTQTILPPRNAHPVLKYKPSMDDIPTVPVIGDTSFPVDRYEVENSPLTQEIAEKSERFKHWQVYVDAEATSGEKPIQQLCGYLSVQANGPEKVLFFYVLPYEYPRLLLLIDSFNRGHPRKEWKNAFDAYVMCAPPYHISALRRFLLKINLHTLIPESFDQCLSFDLQNYLRRVKTQAKAIFESTLAYSSQPSLAPDLIPVIQRSTKPLLKRDNASLEPENDQKSAYDDLLAKSVAEQMEADAATFRIHLRHPAVLHQRAHIVLHRNPFDVERDDLVGQLSGLKFSLLHPDRWKGSDDLDKNVPIAQMSNYQDHLKNIPQPLREIDETPKPDRQNLFGNPFVKKKQRMGSNGSMGGMIDETDVEIPTPGSPGRSRRAMSEPRESAVQSVPHKVRSRSVSPAGLRSPTKASRIDTPTEENNNVSGNATEKTEVAHSKRRLDLQPEDEKSAPGIFANLILDEPEEEAPINGVTVNVNGTEEVSDDDSSDTEEDTDLIQKFRLRALKAIKTPGRNFKPILDMINEINGNMTLKRAVIHHIIVEAARFRRESLVSLIKETYAV